MVEPELDDVTFLSVAVRQVQLDPISFLQFPSFCSISATATYSPRRQTMNLTDHQKMTLAFRRLQRAFAVAIYPPFGATTPDELDVEFQRGLDIAEDIHHLLIARAKEGGISIGLMANCPNCNDTEAVRTCPQCRDKESMR